ncbi:MAG TPA: Smr/MutS family protein [Bacteroidales bacterium]|nr:Smr/MutS family protein [Bacteroidales bacterium]HPS16132.1 Smr/MutS family protein [Bacteroidales bacterium]
MIYPYNFEQKTGFDTIRQSLKKLCLCRIGASFVDKMKFSDNKNQIVKLLEQTEEFRQILLLSEKFPTENYFDITPELSTISIEGTYLEKETLFDMKRSLTTIYECITFFRKDKENRFPKLNELTAAIEIDTSILKQLDRILDYKGNIKDDASPELFEIRKEITRKQVSVNKKLQQIINQVRKQGWAPDDIELTVRNGRTVIPMTAAYKRNIHGFIHDESATGQTVFIEPEEAFEMNNEIRELENAEKREIIKILIQFADFIRPEIDDLIKCYHFLGVIDFIRAKALYALQTNSQKPDVVSETLINWVKAKHPLLFLNHKSQKKEIVPLNIKLDKESHILVISGPNAGGKSVCLKTVGLLQYMLQCGMLVPMESYSEAGIFSKIFIDIGDEQSLENDLSTYSSHLLNMKHFMNHADEKTLFLIDEFGTGTEPNIGGAIAESTLEKLNEKKSFGVVTTHYANLKLLAEKNPGIINGAMLFDTDKMKPRYELSIGKPGSSFAFEIAETIGLQKDVMKKAKEKAGIKQISFDRQLQNLDVQKKNLDQKEEQLKVADDFLAEMIDKYQNLYDELEKRKKEIISKAREEAANMLDDTNKIIENTIKEIKETQAEKEKTSIARKKLDDFKEKLIAKKNTDEDGSSIRRIKDKNKKVPVKILQTPIEKGDYVRISGQELIGEVIGIDNKEALIVFGTTQIKTKIDKLEKVSHEDFKSQSGRYKSSGKKVLFDINEKIKNFKISIDIRGMRVDEALSALQNYIDDAVLLSVPEVRILHGKGDGILRKITRDYLRKVKEVKHLEDEILEKGGHGITVVYFR